LPGKLKPLAGPIRVVCPESVNHVAAALPQCPAVRVEAERAAELSAVDRVAAADQLAQRPPGALQPHRVAEAGQHRVQPGQLGAGHGAVG
jgi:hypothetical protein